MTANVTQFRTNDSNLRKQSLYLKEEHLLEHEQAPNTLQVTLRTGETTDSTNLLKPPRQEPCQTAESLRMTASTAEQTLASDVGVFTYTVN